MVIAGRSVFVRDAGDPQGTPVLYFHGTPGSRMDLAFGDGIAAAMGVRVVSFDRPGYGRSEPAPFGLTRIAETAEWIGDVMGLSTISTFGWSGGGPFALAAAAVMGKRVSRVGVASGPAPFQEVPGGLESLGDADRLALSFLPDDPERAAEHFRAGSQLMVAVSHDENAFMAGVDAIFGESDGEVLQDADLRRHLFEMLSEGLRQGFTGIGWDNVAWVGTWDVDLAAVLCPVHLWYGEQDQMPVVHGQWLREHLTDARLEVFAGEGHLGLMRHYRSMLETLTRSR